MWRHLSSEPLQQALLDLTPHSKLTEISLFKRVQNQTVVSLQRSGTGQKYTLVKAHGRGEPQCLDRRQGLHMQESWVQSQAWFQWEHTHTTHTPFTQNPEEPPMVAVRRVRRTNTPTRHTSTCYSLNILFCSLLTPPKFHHKDPHVWLWKNSAKLR